MTPSHSLYGSLQPAHHSSLPRHSILSGVTAVSVLFLVIGFLSRQDGSSALEFVASGTQITSSPLVSYFLGEQNAVRRIFSIEGRKSDKVDSIYRSAEPVLVSQIAAHLKDAVDEEVDNRMSKAIEKGVKDRLPSAVEAELLKRMPAAVSAEVSKELELIRMNETKEEIRKDVSIVREDIAAHDAIMTRMRDLKEHILNLEELIGAEADARNSNASSEMIKAKNSAAFWKAIAVRMNSSFRAEHSNTIRNGSHIDTSSSSNSTLNTSFSDGNQTSYSNKNRTSSNASTVQVPALPHCKGLQEIGGWNGNISSGSGQPPNPNICSWIITAPTGSTVALYFSQLKLYEGEILVFLGRSEPLRYIAQHISPDIAKILDPHPSTTFPFESAAFATIRGTSRSDNKLVCPSNEILIVFKSGSQDALKSQFEMFWNATLVLPKPRNFQSNTEALSGINGIASIPLDYHFDLTQFTKHNPEDHVQAGIVSSPKIKLERDTKVVDGNQKKFIKEPFRDIKKERMGGQDSTLFITGTKLATRGQFAPDEVKTAMSDSPSTSSLSVKLSHRHDAGKDSELPSIRRDNRVMLKEAQEHDVEKKLLLVRRHYERSSKTPKALKPGHSNSRIAAEIAGGLSIPLILPLALEQGRGVPTL